MADVFECAEHLGGCGVIWTPTAGNRRRVRRVHRHRYCPDCLRVGVSAPVLVVDDA